MTDNFGGYQRYKRIEEGAFADCRNMASEEAPCACVRKKRLTVANRDKATGAAVDAMPGELLDVINHGGKPAYLFSDGTVMRGTKRWNLGSATNSGRIYQFGAGIFCPGAKNYVKNVDVEGVSRLDYSLEGYFSVSYTDENGTSFPTTKPAEGTEKDGDYWYDVTNNGVYRYNADEGQWVAWPVYYMKVKAIMDIHHHESIAMYLDNLLKIIFYLHAGDMVNMKTNDGEEWQTPGYVNITKTGAGWFVIRTKCQPTSNVFLTVERKQVLTDYAVSHDNRVWACRFGLNWDGDLVNEIYASALGDPATWTRFEGTAADSFMATVGEPGDWTGATVVGDNVVFFKEHCFYTVYGDSPENYTVQLTPAPGVQKGSERSLVRIGAYTYYQSPVGIMRLVSGGLPVLVSDELFHKDPLTNGIGGTDGRKYYLQADNEAAGETLLYVYDTLTQRWQIETPVKDAVCFTQFNDALLAAAKDGAFTYISPAGAAAEAPSYLYLCRKNKTTGELIYPAEGFEEATEAILTEETDLPWQFTTGNFGHEEPDYKRVKGISVRAWRDRDAAFNIEVMYDDDGTWHELEISDAFSAGETGTNRVDYRLRRCDLYRLRVSGHGRVCVYSITHTYEGSGDRSYGNNPI